MAFVGDVGEPGTSSRQLLTNASGVASFAARGALYALLMVAVIPSLTYPPVYRAWGNILFDRWGGDRVARFESFDDPSGARDTIIRVGRLESGREHFLASVGVNSVREGYVPVAMIAILTLATRLPWRQRLRLLAAGLALAQLFVFGRIGITILHGLSRTRFGDGALLQVSSGTAWLLGRGEQILATDLHMTFLVPLLIWVTLLVTSGELRGLEFDRSRS